LKLAKEARLSRISREIDRQHAHVITNRAHSGRSSPERSVPKKGEDRMATVVSMINMKGGDGKTTLALHLAHAADSMDLRTRAIDLDPQSNLSQALMGPREYVAYIEQSRPTVVQVFDEYVPSNSRSASSRVLDINKV